MAQTPRETDFLVLGPRLGIASPVLGLGGRLEVEPLLFTTRPQVEMLVRGGVLPAPWLRVQALLDNSGAFALGPSRSVASLLDGDMPLGEISYSGTLSDSSEVDRPVDLHVTMRLMSEPDHANFTRELRFRDLDGDDVHLPLAFTRSSGLTWTATLPEGIGALQGLVDTGERAHWDLMSLVNRGGTTRLEIAHLEITVDYEVTNFRQRPTTETISIPLVDRWIGRVLEAGTSVLPLNAYAEQTRRAFAGVDSTFPEALLQAVDDLGKSGSDGGLSINPKYDAGDKLLCSEFVSWYYHNAGVSITSAPNEFRDIIGTQQLHDLFRGARRLCRYDSGSSSKRFEDPDTGSVYTPGPGDFLEWRKDGSAMHAMMLLSYDSATHVATVINGPWPVRLMEVDLQWWEEETGAEHDFWVGSIPR